MIMFDPTMFDNLKVVLENQLYDLDNLDEHIKTKNRCDIMDFAVLSRKCCLLIIALFSKKRLAT